MTAQPLSLILAAALLCILVFWAVHERLLRVAAEREVRALTADIELSRAQQADLIQTDDPPPFEIHETAGVSLQAATVTEVEHDEPVFRRASLDEQIGAPIGPGGRSFVIAYENAEGEGSERRITILEVRSERSGLYLDAHDYLSGQQRTFRADRILRMVDLASGNTISDPRTMLAGFVDTSALVTDGHDSVMSRSRPGLKPLVWIARASGALDDADLDALVRFVKERATMSARGPVDFDEGIARQWIADSRPVMEDAQTAIGRMRRGGPEWSLVARFAAEMTEADVTSAREKRRKRLAL